MNDISSKLFLGIEFGSTRIKAALIDESLSPVASGSYAWENRFENGLWTYSLGDIIKGLQGCYASLKADVKEHLGFTLKNVDAIGISAMMHGLMAFDKDWALLTPFRTWRNTNTTKAAEELTSLFDFNIPERWSIAHLYQSVLDKEDYLFSLSHLTTLAGYIHYRLSGKNVLGVGEASGMFPVNNGEFDKGMLGELDKKLARRDYSWSIYDILPKILFAGDDAGTLTDEGAMLLDPEGDLKAGAKLCPPEGDAGTGMVATNSVRARTGNVSAGTSIFAMLVLDEPMKAVHKQIDIVTTPDGTPVAMVHCNNCCSEIDVWVSMMNEFAGLIGSKLSPDELYTTLYKNAMTGDNDCGGIYACGLLSGEPAAGAPDGKPLYYREKDSRFSLANFFKAQLMGTMASLKIGMDILFESENAKAERFTGHGGLFKVEGCASQLLADALESKVTVMSTAGEGGSWGIALLAAYSFDSSRMSLADWLDVKVFADADSLEYSPAADGVKGFKSYIRGYKKALAAMETICK
ncbi:MAG: ATPase [Ruminococcus sp.]|nr:ATPase [Ruminococcus sp.]